MITSGCVTHHKSAALRLGTQTEYSEELDSLSKARRFEVQLFSCIVRIRFSTLMSETIGVSRNLRDPGLSLKFPGCVENGLFSWLREMPCLKACGKQKPQNLKKKAGWQPGRFLPVLLQLAAGGRRSPAHLCWFSAGLCPSTLPSSESWWGNCNAELD